MPLKATKTAFKLGEYPAYPWISSLSFETTLTSIMSFKVYDLHYTQFQVLSDADEEYAADERDPNQFATASLYV